MPKVPTKYLVIAGGVFLFVLSIASFEMEGGEIITGVTALYIGSLYLWRGIKDKVSEFGALRFRQIAVAIMALILGIVYLVKYFS
jgi:hypothetical protein